MLSKMKSVTIIINLFFLSTFFFFLFLIFFIKINFFVKAEGVIEPEKQFFIKSEVNGIIDDILVKDGDVVFKNSILLKIKEIDVNKNKNIVVSEYNEAKFLYKNAIILYEKKIISKKDLLAKEKQYNYAIANMKRLDKFIIKSPSDGVVITNSELSLKKGDYIKTGELIFKIAKLNSFIVRTYVLEKDISKLEIGQKAIVEINGIPNKMGFYNAELKKIFKEGKFYNKQKVFEIVLLLKGQISYQRYIEYIKLYSMTGAKVKIIYDNTTFFKFLLKKIDEKKE